MFNFHKPRVYRSTEGCCICRAKSSSSRFTNSRKYEHESMQCFNLKYPRHGEICNACVLLVKRYKRLPVGSKRHWGHVVDARAGPGTKSMAKQKKREDADYNGGCASKSFIPEKFAKIFKKNRNSKTNNTNSSTSSAKNGRGGSGQSGKDVDNRYAAGAKKISDCSDNQTDSNDDSNDDPMEQHDNHIAQISASNNVQFQTQTRAATQKQLAATRKFTKNTGSKRRRLLPPIKNRRSATDNVPFFDDEDLIKKEICCGVVYEHYKFSNFFVIEINEYKPCEKHREQQSIQKNTIGNNESEQKPKQNVESETASVVPLTVTAPTIVRLASPAKPKQTPALKKHHLFFKRQSESFPQCDINRTSPNPLSKTDSTIVITPNTSRSPTPPSPSTIDGNYYVPTTANRHSIQTSHNVAALITKPNTVVAAAVKTVPPSTPLLTTAVGASSPSSTCSSSSSSSSVSSATKFNDNSSDSGFDENVQDRKSVSPPTQDEPPTKTPPPPPPLSHDKKAITTRTHGLQRLIVASGLQITGQPQNLVLAGNELAARIMQQRQQKVHNTIKLQASASLNDSVNIIGSHYGINKVSAIYNNSNTIQHENGITTILPASSLAASNQTAAMNAVVPNTVTITPAPPNATKTKIVAINSTPLPLSNNNNNNNIHSSSISNSNNLNLANNQKIILLKTNSSSAAVLAAAAAAAAKNRYKN